jgi:hypothetical protein
MVVLQISETIESCHEIVETKNRSLLTLFATVDPVYSERGSPHRSLIYSQIKYVYSEYPALVNTFCCTDPFTINGVNCILEIYYALNLLFFEHFYYFIFDYLN